MQPTPFSSSEGKALRAGVVAGGAGRRRRRSIAALKVATVVLAILPLARLGVALFTDRLGANPIAEMMNRLGWWALVWLLLSLAMTPLQLLTQATWPIALRKTLGLIAFTYVALHFATYLGVDQFFDFGAIGRDIVKRKFITVGFLAFVMLIPLAVTSTAGWVKRLGARRWRRLHRFVYPAAVLGVVHFFWRVKSDHREPLLFGLALAVLLGIRLLQGRRAPSERSRRPPPSASAERVSAASSSST